MLLIGLLILIILSIGLRYKFKWNSKRTLLNLSLTFKTWFIAFLFGLIAIVVYIVLKDKPSGLGVLVYSLAAYIFPALLQALLFTFPLIIIHFIMSYLLVGEFLNRLRKLTYIILSGIIGIVNIITLVILNADNDVITLLRIKKPYYLYITMFVFLIISSIISLTGTQVSRVSTNNGVEN